MVLLKAAPRHAAGYALLEVGAATIRVSLPDELAPESSTVRPAKRPRLSGDKDKAEGSADPVPEVGIRTEAGAGGLSSQAATAGLSQEGEVASDSELPSVHSSSRTGARVTSSSAATEPADPRAPLLSMPNLIARGRGGDGPRQASNKRRIYVADQISNECTDFSSLHLRSPIERGFVTDWAAQKVLWDRAISVSLAGRNLAPRQPLPYTHAMAARTAKSTGLTADVVSWFEFGTDLQSRLLEERTVIVTEPYFNLPENAAAMDTLFFEQYGAAAIWRVTPAQMVPFAPIFREKEVAAHSDAHAQNTTGLSVPDCLLVVDLGHSSTNIVPLICAQAQWRAARRLDIGGKLLTNLLKETLSFRQWDVTDETWLVQAVKERCCFLAPCAGILAGDQELDEDPRHRLPASVLGPSTKIIVPTGTNSDILRRRRNEVLRHVRATPPSQWGWTLLVELCKLFPTSNPVLQEYVLPDYSEPASIKKGKQAGTAKDRVLGYVRHGAGSQAALTAAAIASSRESSSSQRPLSKQDGIVADLSLPCERKAPQKKATFGTSFFSTRQADDSDSDEDGDNEDEDDDDDFDPEQQRTRGGARGSDTDERSSESEDEESQDAAGPGGADPDAQVLKLGNERFSIPEVLFDPGRLGLAEAPLHEAIAASIKACPADVRDMMWSNIVLVGGGARLPGLKTRLENELRSLAPDDAIIHFWEMEEPENAAAHGALALLQAASNSPEARFFRAHLVNRTEWGNAGAAVCRARFGGWMAMHDGSAHIRRGDGDDDEDEDGPDGEEASGKRKNGGVGSGMAGGLEAGGRAGPSVGPANAKGKGRIVKKPARVVAAPAPSQPGGEALVKRPRGRPKGSTNKSKV